MSINTSVAGTSTSANGAVLVLARLLLSIMFILGGFGKLTDIAGTAGWFGSIGLPAPTVVAVLVGLLELVGGLAILVGFKTRIAAIALAVFTIAATLDRAHQLRRPDPDADVPEEPGRHRRLPGSGVLRSRRLSVDARRG